VSKSAQKNTFLYRQALKHHSSPEMAEQVPVFPWKIWGIENLENPEKNLGHWRLMVVNSG
jgi:hypothetical protein